MCSLEFKLRSEVVILLYIIRFTIHRKVVVFPSDKVISTGRLLFHAPRVKSGISTGFEQSDSDFSL